MTPGTSLPSRSAEPRHAAALSARHIVSRVGEVAFALWLILSLITPSWRYGPFAWLPLWQYEELAGAPMRVGAANLLPLIVVTCLLLSRWRARPRPPWTWGPPALTLPLAGLTVLGTLSLDTGNFRHVFIYGGMYAVAWLVYLVVLNERPHLLVPIAAVLIIQGAVAAGQFLAQRDLGLVPLGELPLHPAHEGNSVLLARGQPWLRAYGLTIHPNLLGALLAALLLLALPMARRERGAERSAVLLALVVGGAGLFLSFSRASWLGFAAGLGMWGMLGWWEGRRMGNLSRKKLQRTSDSAMHRARQVVPWLLGVGLLALLLFAYRDLVFSRLFALDTPTEAQSIDERQRDAALAVAIIRDAPLTGVGLGDYLAAAQRLDADAARVHNVPLLVAAELGLPGLVIWAWLMAAPFWLWLRPGSAARHRYANLGPRLAPWVAMLVINTFDTTLWLSGNWQTSFLFALVAACAVSKQ